MAETDFLQEATEYRLRRAARAGGRLTRTQAEALARANAQTYDHVHAEVFARFYAEAYVGLLRMGWNARAAAEEAELEAGDVAALYAQEEAEAAERRLVEEML